MDFPIAAFCFDLILPASDFVKRKSDLISQRIVVLGLAYADNEADALIAGDIKMLSELILVEPAHDAGRETAFLTGESEMRYCDADVDLSKLLISQAACESCNHLCGRFGDNYKCRAEIGKLVHTEILNALCDKRSVLR